MNKRPWYVYFVVGLLLAVPAYLAYFKPQLTELKNIRQTRVKVEGEVEMLRAKKQQLDKIEKELEVLRNSLAELETIIPQKKEIGEILRSVQQMADAAAGITVLRFVPDREIPKSIYVEQPIPIQVVGNYHNLGRFLTQILHFPRLFNIDDFSIKALAKQTDPMTISAQFTAKTYYFLEQSQIPKPKPNKPGKPKGETNADVF
jgi:type IV pilus assembly protein PilO